MPAHDINTPSTFTIPLPKLARLIRLAIPCAGTDRLMPVFRSLHFIEREGALWVESTDRYVMIRVRSDVPVSAGLSFLLDRDDCTAVLSAFKPRPRSSIVLAVTVTEDRCVLALEEGALAYGADLRMTLNVQEGAYPKLDGTFDRLGTASAEASLPLFESAYLRRFPAGPVQVKAVSGRSPVGFYGDDWAALAMPLRPVGVQDSDMSTLWTSKAVA